jgi:hypothetical protein
MVRMTVLTAWVAGAAMAVPAVAAAQHWDETPRVGVCLYKDADFRGRRFCLAAGEEVERLPSNLNDEVSSIQIYGRAEVTIFRDDDFRGSSTRFAEDVRDLQHENWNDRVSSVRVRGRGGYGSGGGSGSGSGYGRPDADQIVRRAYQDVLEREPDQQGLRTYRSRILDEGWTERQVRDSLRASPEYREKTTMTYPKAQEVVRRAYLAVLRREPDAASGTYVNKVLRDKWTQADVERELRNSAEYRNRPR